ncbi:TPA: hypothetical protein N0F65_006470 [Lagenidium giganteum]|uniref:serine C-palmitoyltransferase n=1 Tax=Lagenidium giganteum TaxID=4803 RepID=A0AAV2YG35_9STRA|nr:TPA: hypothetical protein N0F65_006470 [Lagenidium giganteum]
MADESIESPPWLIAVLCYTQYLVLLVFGYLREYCGRLSGYSRYKSPNTKPGFARLLLDYESFYTHRVYHRLQEVFNRPVSSSPGAHIDVVERYTPDGGKTYMPKEDGSVRPCLNLASYNYLGFADDWLNTCSKDVFEAVETYGLASSTPPMEYGTSDVHQKLERAVAEFIGKPAAFVYNMGYGTNATTIPALMGKGTLIISDSLNHSSIINGARISGATVTIFRHNDPSHLESVLRRRIADGQPRTHYPWKKIWVVVEGIYSMEGEMVQLRRVIDIVKKYKAYSYVDEAHSIGALGATGRGICEYAGVDPSEVDILMGTFSKSFGGMGGYIAASEDVIEFIRTSSAGATYATSLSPIVAQQILTALNIIWGRDGTDLGKRKLQALRENSNYFRAGLEKIGFLTIGSYDSPVIPVIVYSYSKSLAFARACWARKLAVVTVGFPVTPLLLGRARFCISAAHTKEDMDHALKALAEVSELTRTRFAQRLLG